jgi:hypothetical protein
MEYRPKQKMSNFWKIYVEDNLENLEYGNDVSDTTPMTQSMKEMISKLCFIKIIDVCSIRGNIKE